MTVEGGNIVLITPRSAASYGEKIIITVEADTATIESRHKQWQLGGKKKNAKNLEDITAWLNELSTQYTPEQLEEKYTAAYQAQEAYKKDFEERKQAGSLTAAEKISYRLGGHYVTYTLMAVNVAIFILMVLSGAGFITFDVEALFKWGGNVKSLTTNGEWYRLLTSTFIHGGLIHVAFNMYALFYIGLYLEPLLGRWRYLTVYLACGIFASLTSVWWSDDRISVGASGAIFGLYGVFLALLTTDFIDKNMRKAMLQSIGVFVVFNLVYGMKAGIDNSAHVGGLVSGAVFGYIYYFFFLRSKDNLPISIILTIVITAAAVIVVLPRVKDDSVRAANTIERYIPQQDKALAPVNNLRDSDLSSDVAKQLTDISMPIWVGWQKSLDSSKDENMSKAFRPIIDAYRQYVDLRVKETELLIKKHSEHTYIYDSTIAGVRAEIDKVVTTINKHK